MGNDYGANAKKMKLGILQTDELPDDFYLRYKSLTDVYGSLLRGDFEFTVYKTQEGNFPVEVNEVDAFILGGSRESVYSGSDKVQTMLDYIRKIYEAKVPLIGICFGHQAVAFALGGQVSPNPKGWEVGLMDIKLTSEATNFGLSQNTIKLPTFHRDEVTQMPSGATLLAQNDFSKVQAYRLSYQVLCFQSHPEFSTDMMNYFLQSGRNNISEEEKASAEASLALENQRDLIGQLMRKFLNQRGRP